MHINELGKGILPDLPDPRDYKLEQIVAVPVVDWSKDILLPDVENFDQMMSDACGPVGSSFYHEQLISKIFSKRDLSSRTLLAYGSYARDNILAIVNEGQADKVEVLDPENPTPENMRDTTGTAAHERIDDREADGYSFPAYSIDYAAYCVANFKGCVFGVFGDSVGWVNPENPKPPLKHEWGHLLYAQGYHLHDSQKCIIAKSSWYPKSTTIKYHHIKEDYFKNDTMSPWVIIPRKELNMSNAIFVKKAGTLEHGFYLPGTTEESLKDKALNLGREDILNSDGSVDFSKAKEVSGL